MLLATKVAACRVLPIEAVNIEGKWETRVATETEAA